MASASAELGSPHSVTRPTTSEEFAYHALRTDILTGRIPAGARVVQSDIALQLNISVTPVREAMRRLQSEGLVELVPHKGATVRGLDIGKAREIYELRMMLEPLLAERSLPNIPPARLTGLTGLCDAMDKADNVSQFAEVNQTFHDGLTLEDDSWLTRVVKMLRVAASPYVAFSLHAVPELMTTSNAEHRQMLEAYAVHDMAAVRKLTVQHLSSTLSALEDHL